MTPRSRVLKWVVMLTLMSVAPSYAQRTLVSDRQQAGLFGDLQLVRHELGTGAGLSGIPSCGTFNSGSGSGIALGLLYQYPLMRRLSAQLRTSYSTMNGTLTSREVIGNGIENGEVVDAEVEYSLAPSLGLLSVEPMIVWNPLAIPLNIGIGAQVGSFVGKNAEQKETLLTPRSATFVGGSAIRNAGTGDMAIGSSYLAAIGGLSYDILAAENLVIAPEVSFHIQLNESGDSPWHGNALRLGVALKTLIGNPLEQRRSSAAQIAADVKASGLYADSSEQPIVQVRIEEFLGTQLRPLLNYVFFDDNERSLPARYDLISQDAARGFSVENLHYLDVLATYHHILNIVGRRMTEYPSSTLRLIGCNSQAGAERNNDGLAGQRAEWVKSYLQRIWDIAGTRISVESRRLPDKPSNASDPDGIAENRRVELYSDDPRILAPVVTNDTLRTASPPGIRFRSTVEAQAGISAWRLSAGQGGRMLKEFSGSGSVPRILDWRLEEDQRRVPKFPEPIDYVLEITDMKGQKFETDIQSIATDQITIQRKKQERVADKEVNRYSLILFDFGSADINPDNKRIIDFIKNRITINSTVTVTGYTDRVGDPEFNRRLSEQRASATTQALGVGKPSGAGETMLYDNDLPEGRFYCRTVKVVVETPITE